MYLKRLELKGFKSFANKTTMALEPGVSAIVGPNGSGKSNICDAILWVLGERNAKNLRGGLMEDVIFAGSSERGSVGMAEVSLVLDNTDETLPVEYSDVSITRRLFRNGESDYLINGVSARRLDVLDILHDSGLGSDTNSIISQGNLDSVLSSQPIERRSLIEEAAGVLKHKQRMQRSNNKLERMGSNLERIGDIMAEIERQLKPLRIKAKRARAYNDIMDELNDLTIDLAVDDLKQIHCVWQQKTATKDKLAKEVEGHRIKVDRTQKALDEVQEKLAGQSAQIVKQASIQRGLSGAVQQLQAIAMLLGEKENNAKEKLANSSNDESNSDDFERSIQQEIEAANETINNLKEEYETLVDNQSRAHEKTEKIQSELNDADSKFNKNLGEQNSISSQIGDLRTKLASAQDSVSEAQSKLEANKNVVTDYEKRIADSDKAASDLQKTKNTIKTEHGRTTSELKKIQSRYDEISDNLTDAKSERDSLQNDIRNAESEIFALNNLIAKLNEQDNDSFKWVSKNRKALNRKIAELSDEVTVEDEYLPVVESIFGEFVKSFIVAGKDDVEIVFDALKNNNTSGNVRFVLAEDKSDINSKVESFAKKYGGIALNSKISFANKASLALVSNVVVFSEARQAIKAFDATSGIVCSSLDGTVFWPDGRVSVCANVEESQRKTSHSLISCKRDLNKHEKALDKINKKYSKAVKNAKKLTEQVESLYEKLNNTKGQVAQCSGKLEAASVNLQNETANNESLRESLNKAKNEEKILHEAYSATAPQIDKFKADIKDLEAQLTTSKQSSEKLLNQLNNLREQSKIASNAENEAKIACFKNEQQVDLNTSLVNAANEKLSNYKKSKISEENAKNNARIVAERCKNLQNVINVIEFSAQNRLNKIDSSTDDIDVVAKRLQDENKTCQENLDNARDDYETSRSSLQEVEVELGGLKVKVQAAVDKINDIDKISVDQALKAEDIEDRPGKEERAFKLRRRIANMGTINMDAPEEYEQMRGRYDFLQGQIDDINSARTNLNQINKIIEARMKDDFINTYHQVNSNFQEIFAILFPGGKARLELVEPDNIEESGIEVKAQPKGKRISKMSLMSGGEKSLVALCLLFAVYKTRATPFYILDEVEAALDDTNLRRLIKYLDNLRNTTQLIMITHQRRTMEMADTLYGVSMKQNGITNVVTQKLDAALRYANSENEGK